MGTLINRIEKEFIFKATSEQKSELQFRSGNKVFKGFLVDFDNDILKITLFNKDLTKLKIHKGDELEVYLSFHNTPHTFTAEVVDYSGAKLTLKNPEGVYKNPERRHERVKNPADIHVLISLKDQSLEMDFPKLDNYTYMERPLIDKNFDEKDLKKITQEFHQYMKNTVSDYKIIILKNRGIENWEEEYIYKSTLALWIPSTLEALPIIDPFPDNNRILTQNRIARIREKEESRFETTKLELVAVLSEKAKAGIYSELYFPLLYKQYFIGYIYLKNTFDKKEKISIELIEYVHTFSKILCYFLEIHGYFKSYANENKKQNTVEQQNQRIIDISASGLLFAVKAKHEISKQLLLHSNLKVVLKVLKRNIQIDSQITRKYSNEDILYIGIQFLDIKPEDYCFLYEILYGKRFSEEDDKRWEGGTPPPMIKFE